MVPARSPGAQSGAHAPGRGQGERSVREGCPGRRGQCGCQTEEGERALGTTECAGLRGKREPLGFCLAVGTAEIERPAEKGQTKAVKCNVKDLGSASPQELSSGVSRGCVLERSYESSGVKVCYQRITKASVLVKAPKTCCEQLYLKSEKCLDRGPQRQMLTHARRAMSVSDQACTALANRGAQ